MGPVTISWYTDRGLDHTKETWCAGRIDIRGVEDEPFGLEYGLPVMSGESWGRLSNFFSGFSSKELLTFDQLIEKFEENNNKIVWWKDE